MAVDNIFTIVLGDTLMILVGIIRYFQLYRYLRDAIILVIEEEEQIRLSATLIPVLLFCSRQFLTKMLLLEMFKSFVEIHNAFISSNLNNQNKLT